MMEAIRSSKTSFLIRATRRNILEDDILHWNILKKNSSRWKMLISPTDTSSETPLNEVENDDYMKDVKPWRKPAEHLSTHTERLAINAGCCSKKTRSPDGSIINANESFSYRQLQQQCVRNIVSTVSRCQVSSIIERTVFNEPTQFLVVFLDVLWYVSQGVTYIFHVAEFSKFP
jgi:hypothetical protein